MLSSTSRFLAGCPDVHQPTCRHSSQLLPQQMFSTPSVPATRLQLLPEYRRHLFSCRWKISDRSSQQTLRPHYWNHLTFKFLINEWLRDCKRGEDARLCMSTTQSHHFSCRDCSTHVEIERRWFKEQLVYALKLFLDQQLNLVTAACRLSDVQTLGCDELAR